MSVFCSSCGAENTGGNAFCDQCGSGLSSACPTCGVDNRPEARFCRSCGTRLGGAASEPASGPGGGAGSPGGPARSVSSTTAESPAGLAERRLVSVLFADLVAFTTFSEGRDAEAVRETLSRYFEAARDVIERHGGRVEKFIGDAVMAAWGAPRANEDDAERAVRAALEVLDAVKGLGEGLQARVGVLTGQAAVTVGATDQGMVAGDLVNTAARLQSAAPPDTVLVGEATMQAASSAIAFEPAGEQLLRGKEIPVPAWRALRVMSEIGGRGRGTGIEAPFVGREVELRLLKDLRHLTGQERRPRLVSITGPAGIGKSRLAWEFEKYLDGLVEDTWWHRGRAPSYGEGVTFWALGEMVRRRAGLVEGDDEATSRERIREAVAEHVPDADDRSWVEPALLTLLGLEPPPTGGRDVLFAAWRIFFERIAAQATTVMLFEDLQWADGGQLDFIDHVMEWSRGVPLLIITLARPDLLERRPGWGTSARSFNAIGLEPLTDANVRDLLLGLVPEMPAAAIDRIVSRADGIPLYAVETVRMLLADGRLAPDERGSLRPTRELGELAVPDTLRALVASRLDALDPADRALLQDAAVLGKTFTSQSLSAISGTGDDLDERLRSLVKREMLDVSVDPRSPERGQYGFVQAVIREVAYETLSRRDRRARHLAAARYFESLGEDELAGALATHYLAAYAASESGPESDALQAQARLALRGAAERAIVLGSFDQAMTNLRQALDITTTASERGELLERAAAAANLDGRDEAMTLGVDAIAAFEEAGNHTGVARTSALMGGIFVDASKLTEAVAFLQSALARTEPQDEVHRADMLARLSRAHMRLMEAEPAMARADEALLIAERRQLLPIIAEAFINKAGVLATIGRRQEAMVLLEAAARIMSETGDVARELRARNNLAATLEGEDVEAALRVLREAYGLASRVGISGMSRWVAAGIASAAMWEGLDWDRVIPDLDTEFERSKSVSDRFQLRGAQAVFMAWRGDDITRELTELRSWLSSISDPDMVVGAAILPAILDLASGRPREAMSPFREAVESPTQNVATHLLGLCLSAHWSRDLDAARLALQRAEAMQLYDNISGAIICLARGGIAALEERSEAAVEGFRRAIDMSRRSGARFLESLAQLDALVLLPEEPAIASWADEARERFVAVRSPALLARLDEAVAARGGGAAALATVAEPAESAEAAPA